MDTPAAKHFQEMDAAIVEFQAIEPSAAGQIQACRERILKAWADIRADYGDLMHRVGQAVHMEPNIGDFSNWIHIEDNSDDMDL